MPGNSGASSEELARDAIKRRFNVSRETLEALDRFSNQLRRWSKRINLISPNEASRLWSRHILDSLGLLNVVYDHEVCLDIGSGGGFPAIPLAIVSRETSPSRRFILVESDQRKCVFLREMAREFGLKVDVKAQRIENIEPQGASLISARALADVSKLLSLTENHRASGAKMVLLKGEKLHDELTSASAEWHMRYQAERHPLTLNGYMLIIREAKRAKFR